MRKIRHPFFIVLTLLMIAPVVSIAQGKTPKDTLASFYRFDQTHPQTFNRENIDSRKKWFSPDLYQLFLRELERDKEYLNSHPGDKPFYGDGFPFRPYDETCRNGRKSVHKRIAYGAAAVEDDNATVPVTFAFPKPCKDPDATTYTVKLIRSGSSWLIDDVQFSEDSSLLKDLNRTEY